MGKLKEYYHEEINRGMNGDDQEYAVKNMVNIQRATAAWIAGQMITTEWIQTVMREVTDFENMHNPCQPKW